jgi:hypothetical protein
MVTCENLFSDISIGWMGVWTAADALLLAYLWQSFHSSAICELFF